MKYGFSGSLKPLPNRPIGAQFKAKNTHKYHKDNQAYMRRITQMYPKRQMDKGFGLQNKINRTQRLQYHAFFYGKARLC